MPAGILLVIGAGVLAFALSRYLRGRAEGRAPVVALGRPVNGGPATGAGIAVAAGGSFAAAFLIWMLPGWAFIVALLAMAIAFLGWLDDLRPTRSSLRIVAQVVIVALLVWAIGPARLAPAMGALAFFVVAPLVIGAIACWLAAFSAVERIDGLAALHAAFMAGAAVWLVRDQAAATAPELWWIAAVAAASLGVLPLCWPPARVRLGHAGSGYLGLMLAFATLATIAGGLLTLQQWLLLAAPIAADALVGFIRLLIWAKARRAVPQLAQRYGALAVTVGVGLTDLFVIVPLAWWAGAEPAMAWIAVGAAYVPLALAAFAGSSPPRPRTSS